MAVPIELAKSDRSRSGQGSEVTRQKSGMCFIPLTVESFLWQQTCSFMRARLSKVCDAACASLERILVQGILDGLTPPLAQAINSTPRWYLIRAAFPHILHSCASLLRHRASFGISGERLSPSESKMMYILHWILLDALSECVDSAELETESLHLGNYLLSLDDIRLLVYAIVPLLHTLRESNFNAPRLEAGLKVWQALWRFRQPDVVFLSMPVRVRPHDARLMLQTRPVQVASSNVYVGDSLNVPISTTSRERCPSTNSHDENSAAQRHLIEDIASELTTAASPAVPSYYLTGGGSIITTRPSVSPRTAETFISGGKRGSLINSSLQQLSSTSSGKVETVVEDLTKATYFDVAVLQCLLGTEPWCEEGAHWSVKYLHLRVLDIHSEVIRAKALADAAYRLSRSCSFGARRRPPSGYSPTSPATRPTSMTRRDSFEKLRLIFASANPIRSPHPFRPSDLPQLVGKSPLSTRPSGKAVAVAGMRGHPDLGMSATADLGSDGRPAGLLKSYTDSALQSGYVSEDLEADGCQHYILPDGSIDLEVLLLATALACRRHTSLRVCQSAIQVIHSLALLEIFGSSDDDKVYAQQSKTALLNVSPVVAAAVAGDEHRRFLAAGQSAVASSNAKTVQTSSPLNNRASDFCDRYPPLVTNHNIAVGTLLKIYEILGAPSSSSNANRQSKLPGSDPQTIDYREQLMAYAAETARELHRVDRHQFHSYVNEYVSYAPLNRLIRLYVGALGGRVAQNTSVITHPPSVNVASPNLRAKDSMPVVRHSLRQWLTSVGKHVENLDVSQSGNVLRDISYILNTLAVLHPRLLRRVSVSCILDVVPPGFAKINQAAAEKDETKTAKSSQTTTKQAEEVSTFKKFEEILEKFRLKDLAAGTAVASPGESATQQSPVAPNAPPITASKTTDLPVITLELPSDSTKTSKGEENERLSSVGSASSLATKDPPVGGDTTPDQQVATPRRKIHFKQSPRNEPPEGVTETLSTSSAMKPKIPPPSPMTQKSFGIASVLVSKIRGGPNSGSSSSNWDLAGHRPSITNLPGLPGIFKASSAKQLTKDSAEMDSGAHDKLSQCETGEDRIQKTEPPIDSAALFLGIQRLSLLVDLGIPSALPDASLVASMLDLKAPILPRACFLLECAVAIHAINKQPSRLVANVPSSSAADTTKTHLNAFRQMATICHDWAEAIGTRLAKVIAKELADGVTFAQSPSGSTNSREEAENYFIDSTVNNEEGEGCPHALKRLACMILLETTIFLRETFRTYLRELLNKKHTPSHVVSPLAPAPSTGGPDNKNLPSASPSIASRQQGGATGGQHQAEHASDSLGGSTSSLDQTHNKESDNVETTAPPPSKTGSRGGSFFRRSSMQKSAHYDPALTKRYSVQQTEAHGGSSSPRHSPRQLSDAALESPSQHSAEFVAEHATTAAATLTPSHHHSVHQPETSKPTTTAPQQEVDDQQLMKSFTWLRSVTHLAGYFSFVCNHSSSKGGQCVNLCVERQRRDGLRLIHALRQVYRHSRLPNNAASRHSSAVNSYLDTRCRGLLHAPFSTLLKAACVIDEETWQDAVGPAWELITDSDLEHSAAAACLFLLTTLKLHEPAYDFIQRQLEHAEPVERISAIYRFQLIWQSRFQVWARMEVGAQTRFKVPPPNIDFVLPSPMVGLAISPVVDAPWLPKTSNHLSDVTTLHGHESVKALVTATTTHHRQQIETLNKALMAEEKRIRSARDNYPLSAMCLAVLAAGQEPALAKASLQHGDKEKDKQAGNDDVIPEAEPLPVKQPIPVDYQLRRQSALARPSQTGGPSAPANTSTVIFNAARRFSMVITSAVVHNLDRSGPTPASSSSYVLSVPSMNSVTGSSANSSQIGQPMSRVREAVRRISRRFSLRVPLRAFVRHRIIATASSEPATPRPRATISMSQSYAVELEPQNAPLAPLPSSQIGTSTGVVEANWNEQLNRINNEIVAPTGVPVAAQQVTVTPHSFYTPAACATIAKLLEMLLDYDVGFPVNALHQMSPTSPTGTLGTLAQQYGNSISNAGFGLTPGQAAADVIWHSLCDDPTLTLRFFFERLTHTDKLDKLLLYLRHLVTHYGGLLPPQAAHSITNYFIGLVMFCVRTASDETNETVSKAIAQLAIIVPSLVGFSFKDLKQSLRKEQCDPTLMLSAGVPGAKKLVIHGPDLSSIPSQFPVVDDTQFSSLLSESLDFFNIEQERRNNYYLVDTKTKHVYLPSSYVRDFYPFRRNVYPQLSLVHMRPDVAGDKMRHQTLILKFADVNRTVLNDACLKVLSTTAAPGQVFFIHDEFIRLPTFPRKALQFDHVELVSGSESAWLAKQLHKMDVLHKTAWVDFLAAFLCRLQPSIPVVVDLPLYLSVVTGSLILHTDETSAILRRSLALFINLARHYRAFFATEGYTFICPTIFQIYCCYAGVSAESVRVGIEFACKQMYIIHRKPFLLQLMGSVAELLIASPATHYGKHLCTLLAQIGATPFDSLNVMELVSEPKPLKTLDFCYEDEDATFNLIDCIRLAIAVIAYGGDSPRSSRMLVVLDAIVPQCVQSLTQAHSIGAGPNNAPLLHSHGSNVPPAHGRKQTGRDDVTAIGELAACMKALVAACSFLTKGYSASERQLESTGLAFYMRHGRRAARGFQAAADADLDFVERGAEDSSTGQNLTALRDFRLPRDCLLSIIAAFFPICVARLREIHKTGMSSGGAASGTDQQSSRNIPAIHELLSARDHIRLAEISQTLLKVAPYDPPSMNCVGLERYMVDVLPATNWAQESTRPAFALILRRLDRLFARLVKKASLRQCLDWSAAAALITGVSSTLHQSMYLAHVKEIKSLITSCLNIILADPSEFSTGSMYLQPKEGQQSMFRAVSSTGAEEEDSNELPPAPSSAAFLFAAVRLLATEMQAQGELFGLSSVCEPLIGQSLTAAPTEKLHGLVLSVLMPLLLSASVSAKTAFVMRKAEVSHILTLLLHLASPPHRHVVVSTSAYFGSIGSSSFGNAASMAATRIAGSRSGGPGVTQPLLTTAISGLGRDAHGAASFAMTAASVERERATSAAEAHGPTHQWANEHILATVFLGLKLLSLRFDTELASQWPMVAKHCRGLAMRPIASPSLWRFLGFLATARPSLFALMAPFIRWKLSRLKLSDLSPADGQLQSEVIQSTLTPSPPLPRAQLLLACAEELRVLRRNAAGVAFSKELQQQSTIRGTLGTPSATAITEPESVPFHNIARRSSSAMVAANRLLRRSSTTATVQSEQATTPISSVVIQEDVRGPPSFESPSERSDDGSRSKAKQQPESTSSSITSVSSLRRPGALTHSAQIPDSLKIHSPFRISGTVQPVLESAAEGEEMPIEMAENVAKLSLSSPSKEKERQASSTTSVTTPDAASGKKSTTDEATLSLLGSVDARSQSSIFSEAMSSRTATENRSIVVIVEDSSANEEFL